jgi:hypothetical protein
MEYVVSQEFYGAKSARGSKMLRINIDLDSPTQLSIDHESVAKLSSSATITLQLQKRQNF